MTTPLHGHPDWQESLGTAELLVTQTNQNIAATNSLTTAVLDMRPYSSFGVSTLAIVNAAITAFNASMLSMTWYDDSVLTNQIYRDSYATINFNSTASAFDCTNGRATLQDNVRGPFCVVDFFNAGPQQAIMDLIVYGNSRDVGGRTLREEFGNFTFPQPWTSAILASDAFVIGAGVTRTRVLPMAPGLANINLNAAAAPANVTLTGAGGRVFWIANGVVNLRETIALPDETSILRFTNAGGVNLTGSMYVTATRVAQ